MSYTTVTVNDSKEIDTLKFLEATEGVIALFSILNATAFGIIISDMNGNVTKIRQKYNENPRQGSTLQGIVNSESNLKKKVATEGLLWLRRYSR